MEKNQHNTTIVTRIRNRNSIFADTLANWVQFDIPIIVVDYRDDSCESVYDVVTTTPGAENVTVIETKYEYVFLPSHAWNLGIFQVKTERVLLLDVDVTITSDFFEVNTLPVNAAVVGMHPYNTWHLTGLCFTQTALIRNVGGFNENMTYMGFHDIDMRNRMNQLGCRLVTLSGNTAVHKEHPRRLNSVNQWSDAGMLSDDSHHHIYDAMNELNRRIADKLPWSAESVRVKWTLTELDKNRFLAVRDVTG